jgi:hypothetical protein
VANFNEFNNLPGPGLFPKKEKSGLRDAASEGDWPGKSDGGSAFSSPAGQ